MPTTPEEIAKREQSYRKSIEFAASLGIMEADVRDLARRMDDPVGRKMIAKRIPAPSVQFPHL